MAISFGVFFLTDHSKHLVIAASLRFLCFNLNDLIPQLYYGTVLVKRANLFSDLVLIIRARIIAIDRRAWAVVLILTYADFVVG